MTPGTGNSSKVTAVTVTGDGDRQLFQAVAERWSAGSWSALLLTRVLRCWHFKGLVGRRSADTARPVLRTPGTGNDGDAATCVTPESKHGDRQHAWGTGKGNGAARADTGIADTGDQDTGTGNWFKQSRSDGRRRVGWQTHVVESDLQRNGGMHACPKFEVHRFSPRCRVSWIQRK